MLNAHMREIPYSLWSLAFYTRLNRTEVVLWLCGCGNKIFSTNSFCFQMEYRRVLRTRKTRVEYIRVRIICMRTRWMLSHSIRQFMFMVTNQYESYLPIAFSILFCFFFFVFGFADRNNLSRRISIMAYCFQEDSLIRKKTTKLPLVWWIYIITRLVVGCVTKCSKLVLFSFCSISIFLSLSLPLFQLECIFLN